MTKILSWILLVGVVLFLGGYVINKFVESTISEPIEASENYRDGKFYNAAPREEPSFGKLLEIAKRWYTEEKVDSQPAKPLPLLPVTRSQLDELSDDELHLVKLGHSSMLLKMYGEYWLIDPMFSDRASPFSFLGPKRFQQTPISLADLPPIAKVLISHNHYDHLDKAAIMALASKTEQFLVPQGVEGDVEKWGVDRKKIMSFGWWQELQTDKTLVAFTPTQHFSGRGLSDGNKTLWGSWVIKAPDASLYFSGDSGYFDGFKAIGGKYGPFDLTMIETGAYNTDWADIHMLPEESVQAHIDLKGVALMPVHNSTFDLSFHPWYEPLERVSAEAEKQEVQLFTPLVGEVFTAKPVVPSDESKQWWVNLK